MTADHGKLKDNNSYDMMKDTVNPSYQVGNETVTYSYADTSIMSKELKRLQSKKEVIDEIHFTTRRQNDQMRSLTMRRKAYYRLYGVLVATVILSLVLLVLKNYFPILPEWIWDWLLIFTIGGGLIWAIVLYVDLTKRDKLDFEKIDFGYLLDTSDITDKDNDKDKETNLLTRAIDGNACGGRGCCPNGHFYDNRCNKCEQGQKYDGNNCATESFTTRPTYMRKDEFPVLIQGAGQKTMHAYVNKM
jgi:hypothetical protein